MANNQTIQQFINQQQYQMSTQEAIQFRFPTVRSKLQNLFPFDPKYDIQVIFKNNKYQLQTAYLRLECGFFKNFIAKVVKVEQDFNEDYFQSIMKCFYGGIFMCPRSQVFQAWKIFEYFKIQSFKKQTIKDMKENLQKYNFFQLMAFGFMNSVEEIFGNCLAILDSSNFIQLKRNKQQVMECPLQLFRFLINTHNRRAQNRRALNFIEVNTLLAQYSERNQFSDQFYKELKFQLIEKTQLTAEEYRLIFIEGAKSQSTRQIPSVTSINLDRRTLRVNTQPMLAESAQVFSGKTISHDQKQHWFQKLNNLKSTFEKNQSDSKLLYSSIDSLQKTVKKRANESKNKNFSLSKMQAMVRLVQKEIDQKKQSLQKITERIQKLENLSKGKGKGMKQPEPQEEQNDVFVQSHIIPGYCLGDIMNDQNTKKQTNLKPAAPVYEPTASTANFSKKKKNYYEAQKEKQTSQEFTYKSCLLFDKEPISVPKRYLDSLAKLMDTDSFVKKRQLNLLFRRSRTDKNNIGDPSVIKNRSSLLLLFETSYKKYVGGFISVEVPSFTKADSLCDYQAFIFSLTHNVKMPIMKGEQKSAISLSKHYLLSFANDLMISNDCLNQVSYCEWPGIYEVPQNSKCTSTRDLIGSSGEFKIEQIDIYEVKNEEIQMII